MVPDFPKGQDWSLDRFALHSEDGFCSFPLAVLPGRQYWQHVFYASLIEGLWLLGALGVFQRTADAWFEHGVVSELLHLLVRECADVLGKYRTASTIFPDILQLQLDRSPRCRHVGGTGAHRQSG